MEKIFYKIAIGVVCGLLLINLVIIGILASQLNFGDISTPVSEYTPEYRCNFDRGTNSGELCQEKEIIKKEPTDMGWAPAVLGPAPGAGAVGR